MILFIFLFKHLQISVTWEFEPIKVLVIETRDDVVYDGT